MTSDHTETGPAPAPQSAATGFDIDIDIDEAVAPPAGMTASDIAVAADAAARAALASTGDAGEAGGVSLSSLSVSLLLTGDDRLQALNKRFRGQDRPTNVLSFPAGEAAGERGPAAGPRHLGDIAISLDTLAREALSQETPFCDHLRHIVVHGMLHLLGYDHQDDDEADAMEAREARILARLGVPDPYGLEHADETRHMDDRHMNARADEPVEQVTTERR